MAEAANGCTLFLDEIADIPYPLQVKLLRLLETGTYRPVGSTEQKATNFRLICATHRDIEKLVDKNLFRQDLYYRINVFSIQIPSLQERTEDIPLIAKALLKRISPEADFSLTSTAVSRLKKQYYRGNIRELRNILTRATVLANTDVIDNQVLDQCFHIITKKENEELSLKSRERLYLSQLMGKYNQDKERVAKIADISVRSLYRKLSDYKLSD